MPRKSGWNNMPNDLDHLAYLLVCVSEIAVLLEAHSSFGTSPDKQSNIDYGLTADDITDAGKGHGRGVVLACPASANAALGGPSLWLINNLSPWHNCTSCAGE
jgi:hypothetical protein